MTENFQNWSDVKHEFIGNPREKITFSINEIEEFEDSVSDTINVIEYDEVNPDELDEVIRELTLAFRFIAPEESKKVKVLCQIFYPVEKKLKIGFLKFMFPVMHMLKKEIIVKSFKTSVAERPIDKLKMLFAFNFG